MYHVFRNIRNPRDIAITDCGESSYLPTNVRWSYSGNFADSLKAAIVFNVLDIAQFHKEMHEKGYWRGNVKRVMRSARNR